jgi:hypothetical protein
MGQKQHPADRDALHTRTPTSDGRQDANDRESARKDVGQHQAGHQPKGRLTGKPSISERSAQEQSR